MTRMLVVEDDDGVAASIRFVLERNGFEVVQARSGTQARSLLADGAADCALIDVWLGEEDGLDVLAGLRAEGNHLPVIVMSGGGPGKSLEAVSTRADVLDARSVLFKPFTDEELLTAARACCTGDGH